MTIPEIASELNVGTVMEGSVRYAGNRIRITTQLIDAATDQHLWSETYDREFDDIFAIESDTAMNVANAMEAEFSLAEQAAIEQVPTSSPEAYVLFLQARSLLATVDGYVAANALIDRALEIDPQFAGALGTKTYIFGASMVNSIQTTGVAAEDRAALERQVREYAQRTFELEPGNAMARTALRAIDIPTWRWSAYLQALEPGDEDQLAAAGIWVYAWMGRQADAVRIARRVAELNPNDFSSHLFLGVSLAYVSEYDAAMQSLQRGHELAPGHPLVQAWKAYIEIARGNSGVAAAELRLIEQLLSNNRPIVFLPELAYGYSRIGSREDVERILAEIEALENPDEFGAGAWAVTYLAIGDEERALEQLEIVAAKARNYEPDPGYLNVMNLKMNYLADPALEKPEFVDVLGRIRGD